MSHNVHLNVATVIFDAWEPFQGVFLRDDAYWTKVP
jgi:hypothetical protein